MERGPCRLPLACGAEHTPLRRAAECAPPPFIRRKRHRLLAICDEMGAQDGPHTGGLSGALKFHCAIHSIGVGAGQGTETALRRGLGQRLRAGDAESEGEVGVEMEVGDHLDKSVNSKQ